ncbi:MAG TPA: HAD-IIIC family phosphatase [Kofleriaceae bacterium]
MVDVRSLPLEQVLRSRKRLRRELQGQAGLRPLRVAVLGGTTTNEVVDLLELLLLSDGFAPAFYQSEYNRFYEDATLDVHQIVEFKPDLVYLHTHVLNVSRFPSPDFAEADLEARVADELARFQRIWESIHANVRCQIIQNNFEHPPFPVLGNLDSTVPGGHTRFVYELNRAFARAASADRRLLVHDIHSIAARIGLGRWFDWERWFSYKILTTPEASYELAMSLASQIGAMRGRARKVLVLDLDNTLWGGVIGDDGVDKLQIGKETAVAEAYTAFQRYCLSLRDRGVLLAVCSKNEEAIARTGFEHPDSVLRLEHFSAFKANWEPKPENIQQIASELNLGLDSLVFVDDNPAERAIVRAQLPVVAVPEVGADVAQYPGIVQAGRFFEMVAISTEDLARADAYAANQARTATQAKFKDYGAYLDSLEMTAEIAPFRPVYLERITQLINKTNQFNLTTRRYTQAEIEQIAADPRFVPLYGRLADTFGDNGLISVIIGRLEDRILHIDLWIMSCRVLKRDMELAMLDALAQRARAAGATELRGSYLPTPKNAMVADHYKTLGFRSVDDAWRLDLGDYTLRNRHIKVQESWTETASSKN